ncbi:MAG: alanine--tRNA ligase [Sulfobacillus acidophilus]|uniref:Alanine--tRNA ligase n=1 Tax=Sulfobacillus acidophilus TaxID=53633 RepID=A0A2T2WPH0_9FIRM|nr:MAG: alanine--tRNA ligase [Sulfobacillus acidophilus]
MEARVIRQKFLRFFEERGHQRVPSSPLVPAGDPTLLFTNAGMVQFKDVFLGVEQRSYRRAVTVQKCMRAGGKHNDLDQVGRTARHQTFFEMLGNFSFGDYFKRDAIRYAWTFLTEELQLSADVLWITVFENDDEAFALWQEVAGVSADRIVRLGAKDNFWAMGDTGPCGPCSEIFVDRGLEYACGPDCGLGQCECDRLQEIWNLVFMQYDRASDGTLTPLPRPSIDTGMGLERIAAYLQGVDSNFDTDLLRPLINAVEVLAQRPYSPGPEGMAFRVIADHVRSIAFLVAEGVSFSNEGRGYVMRRILRRAMRYGLELGLESPFLHRLVPEVVRIMGDAYPELRTGQSMIEELVFQEEERFLVTLNAGMKVLEQKLAGLQPGQRMSGTDAFLLADTFGFPLDLTRDAALERGVGIDEEAFEALMEDQRRRARVNRTRVVNLLPAVESSEFVGYSQLELQHETILGIYVDQDRVTRLQEGESGWLHARRTPFYPEGGGQVGDSGRVMTATGWAEVEDTVKVQGAIWHAVVVREGHLMSGQEAHWVVDRDRRAGAMRNHTGTHLLHAALRAVLGAGVRQTGSLVAWDRLRFDFSYPKALTREQIHSIEKLVNGWILDDIAVEIDYVSRDEALRGGALAFFGEKYGEVVRVITVPGASQELCGGTHCTRTGQIGLFAIVDESSVGGGSRRIEAVTGLNSWKRFDEQRTLMQEIGKWFAGLAPEQWPERIEGWVTTVKTYEQRQQDEARLRRARLGRDLALTAREVGSLRFVVAEVPAESSEALREVLDGVKPTVDGAILAARHGDRASLIVYFGDEIRRRGFLAKEVVKPLSRVIDGGGGGRDDLAQAGGRAPEEVPTLLAQAQEWIEKNFGIAG